MTTYYNRVKWTAVSAGAGDFVVSAAVAGYRTPAQASVPDAAAVRYVATNSTETEWEIGNGTYTSGTTTLARTTVLENHLGDTSTINFSTAPVVWFDFLAQDVVDAVAPGGSTTQFQYNNAGAFGGANVWRESANLVTLRNGVTAQSLQVYNTYTDGSNYERGAFDWSTSANTLTIGTQKAGTGSSRNLQLLSLDNLTYRAEGFHQFLIGSTTHVYIATDGVIAGADNSYNVGRAGLRFQFAYLGTTTVGALPAAGATLMGARTMVTDANAATFGTTAAAGGANIVPVWCDGTVWKIG